MTECVSEYAEWIEIAHRASDLFAYQGEPHP